LQETFRYVDNSSHHEKWWKGEPIWHTAALHGYKTAVCMWPGSNVVRDGRLPDYLIQYNHSVTPDEKVDMILSWLDLPVSQRPKFMAMYFAEVDEAGHMYGPDSAEVMPILSPHLLGQ
jgi:predicted AlkP superfamily pyrophosphatase or phosphodiesterase